MQSDYLSYPHRCRHCEYADELKNYTKPASQPISARKRDSLSKEVESRNAMPAHSLRSEQYESKRILR